MHRNGCRYRTEFLGGRLELEGFEETIVSQTEVIQGTRFEVRLRQLDPVRMNSD